MYEIITDFVALNPCSNSSCEECWSLPIPWMSHALVFHCKCLGIQLAANFRELHGLFGRVKARYDAALGCSHDERSCRPR